MFHKLRANLVLLVIFTIITGMGYPLAVLGLGQTFFADKANGSLIIADDTVIGSRLLGQNFTADRYFHPRPSMAGSDGYDALRSGASNAAVASDAYTQTITNRMEELKTNGGIPPFPTDMITASASGLDPHISIANAHIQVGRIAEARGLSIAHIEGAIAAHTAPRTFGILGEPRVNVLELNMALDSFAETQEDDE